MTTTLHRVLVDLAGEAPSVRMPEDLWRRGRRLRRRRRAAGILACLLVSMTAMWLPSPNATGSQFAGTDDRTLPAWAAQPYLWQQTFSEDPNGPAKLVFETGHSLDLDTSLVVVGRDDSFRLVYLDPGELMGSLSPDGRYLLGDNLVDLVTGQSRKLSPAVSSHWPAVWSPDSQNAVAVIGQDDVVPTIGPNGERINDSTRLDNIVIVSVPDGRLRVVHVAEADVFRAAFSPDGTRVAITVGRDAQNKELLILDVATGTVQRAVPLGERQQIAGSAAWSPDGNQLILTFIEGCLTSPSCDGPTPDRPARQRFHLQHLDVDTGTVTDEAVRGRLDRPNLIAWRQGAPVLSVTNDADNSCAIVRLPAGQSPETLPLRAAGYGCPSYPRNALEQWTLDGPQLTPSPWQAQNWAYVVLGLIALIGAALVVKLGRRWRRRSTTRRSRVAPEPPR
ncbi:WD40 repeat domain-containing protein [Catellatospora aurea]|uniref:WD40 repeat domain-containing protein n=1 Tax=Catellatospora aurea TaxID=1337874 RepID=A0ABW2H3K1_9ACTN